MAHDLREIHPFFNRLLRRMVIREYPKMIAFAFRNRVVAVATILVLSVIRSGAPAGKFPGEGESSPRFALLVGVQRYAYLDARAQLDGCRNDVKAMRALLVGRFGFPKENVRVLLDEEATGERIRAAQRALVERLDELPGDGPPVEVVFHYSGHGSQLPDQTRGADRDEADGLDETLVPFDAVKQGGEQDIRDDELFRFVQQICENERARLWVILDCCHSGTGVRGATKIRQVARPRLEATPRTADTPIVTRTLPDGVVMLSSCRASEFEPEITIGGQSYGLLTRYLVEVLHESGSISGLSYAGLRRAIVAGYRSNPRVIQAPMPQLEGGSRSLRRTVLGAGDGTNRPPYRDVAPAGDDRGSVVLKAGFFHGVTAESIYELYQRPEEITWNPDQTAAARNSIGWLEVESVDGTTSKATVFEWSEDRTERYEAVLPRDFRRGYAVERYHHMGSHGIRVRVVRALDAETDGPPLEPGDPGVPVPVRNALSSTEEPGETDWALWVGGEEACDLLLRIDPPHAALFPASGMAGEIQGDENIATRGTRLPKSLRGGWGPIDLRDPRRAETQMKQYLRRITRGWNLIRLADVRGTRGDSVNPIDLGLVSVTLDDDYRILDWEPWPSENSGLTQTRLGDIYAVRVTTPESSGRAVYVTVLGINADMEIDVILPYQPGDQDAQRLAPGEDKITDAFRTEAPAGPRWIVALATREPNNLYLLAQPALPKVQGGGTRGAWGTGMRDPASPTLQALLLQQMYFQTRDARLRPQKLNDDSWSAALLPWRVVP